MVMKSVSFLSQLLNGEFVNKDRILKEYAKTNSVQPTINKLYAQSV